MNTETALVETLTAEVRVLAIGSRHITQSMYEQLDAVHWEQIEPFGRVHPRRGNPRAVHVIGRDSSGQLVCSSLSNDTDEPFATLLSEREAAFKAWQELPLIILGGLQ